MEQDVGDTGMRWGIPVALFLLVALLLTTGTITQTKYTYLYDDFSTNSVANYKNGSLTIWNISGSRVNVGDCDGNQYFTYYGSDYGYYFNTTTNISLRINEIQRNEGFGNGRGVIFSLSTSSINASIVSGGAGDKYGAGWDRTAGGDFFILWKDVATVQTILDYGSSSPPPLNAWNTFNVSHNTTSGAIQVYVNNTDIGLSIVDATYKGGYVGGVWSSWTCSKWAVWFDDLKVTTPSAGGAAIVPDATWSCSPIAGVRNSTRSCVNSSQSSTVDFYGTGPNPCIGTNVTSPTGLSIFPRNLSWCSMCMIAGTDTKNTSCKTNYLYVSQPWAWF